MQQKGLNKRSDTYVNCVNFSQINNAASCLWVTLLILNTTKVKCISVGAHY